MDVDFRIASKMSEERDWSPKLVSGSRMFKSNDCADQMRPSSSRYSSNEDSIETSVNVGMGALSS